MRQLKLRGQLFLPPLGNIEFPEALLFLNESKARSQARGGVGRGKEAEIRDQ